MEEIKQEVETITIRKTEGTKKDGGKFDKFVFNKDGKAIQLSFRKDSNNLSVIPYGYSNIKVKNLKPANASFYPKYYATFIEVAPKETI
jgi:hypothetical protein